MVSTSIKDINKISMFNSQKDLISRIVLAIVISFYCCFTIQAQIPILKSTTTYTADSAITEISISEFDSLSAFQFSLNWDASLLSFVEANPVEPLIVNQSVSNSPSPGNLIAIWFDMSATLPLSIPGEVILFRIEFQNIGNTTNGGVIISDTPQATLFSQFPKQTQLDIEVENCVVNTVSVDKTLYPLANINVHPNPFSEQVTFDLEGINENEIQLFIYNSIGQLVREENYSSSQFTFSRNTLIGGLYFYELKTSKGIFASGELMIKN